MAEIKPNHICRNPKCQKHYYSCNFCDRNKNWRSVACSFECYQEYINLVIAERGKEKVVEVKPKRIDMSEKEVDELLNTPIEVVLEKTKEELSDYANIDGEVNFSDAVDEINRKLDKAKKLSKRNK